MTTTLPETSEQAKHTDDQQIAVDEHTSQIVSFRLAKETYGVGIMHVQEIILIGAITPMPSVPDYIVGLTNLRGHVIPVVDLAKRFRLDHHTADSKTARIVVLNVGERTLGVIVDEVDEVLRVRDSQIERVSQDFTGPGREFVDGLVKLEDRLVILLRVDRILDTDPAE